MKMDRDKTYIARIEHYKWYHTTMMRIGDCDPAYPALCYVADRFELNIEQRFWLAFLFQATYCVPTTFYIYNEFPDFENVDITRMKIWWKENKHRLLFQTDRAKVKNFDKLVPMFRSYKKLIAGAQAKAFNKLITPDVYETYDNMYSFCNNVYYIGRFSLFLYLESIQRLTNFPMQPSGLDLPNASSCTYGLCYAVGLDAWDKDKKQFDTSDYRHFQRELSKIHKELTEEHKELPINYWNIETSLCAYKKLYRKKRYLGYYIDRLMDEIIVMQNNVKEGVSWKVLWDFRREYFHKSHLGEFKGYTGVRKQMFGLPNTSWGEYEGEYKEKVRFEYAKS